MLIYAPNEGSRGDWICLTKGGGGCHGIMATIICKPLLGKSVHLLQIWQWIEEYLEIVSAGLENEYITYYLFLEFYSVYTFVLTLIPHYDPLSIGFSCSVMCTMLLSTLFLACFLVNLSPTCRFFLLFSFSSYSSSSLASSFRKSRLTSHQGLQPPSRHN